MIKSLPLTSFCTCPRSISPKQDGLVDLARRGRPVTWPSRSPDLNPLDFFFWGHLKSLVHETPMKSAKDLVARIVVAADKINTTPGIFERGRQSFLRRCELCNDTCSRHFENLLRVFL
ncbi:hypothetical protein AVEN_104808-1 [Araneus ventricosus]|uniref:Tc1-like transposase DDE domain-containing protein n=1 Tax=Araneus ventricosus TaxID=182803 RepID=A0A4Y2I951_ARAVE|nr:hypothetical protein AVEN_104808-1 [Araneus ventricosus]